MGENPTFVPQAGLRWAGGMAPLLSTLARPAHGWEWCGVAVGGVKDLRCLCVGRPMFVFVFLSVSDLSCYFCYEQICT